MQIRFCATKRHPPWSQNSLRYLENQENYFNQKGLMCRVFKNHSYEMNLYQRPPSPIKRCYSAIHLIFVHHDFIYKTKRSARPNYDEKNKVHNVISAPKNYQIVCVNLNTYVDVNSYSTWDRNM